ncbi:MAG: VanZ family protein [Clostridia bacterium]|nr:VanZ family protein [Clostridia bacterium]
MINISFVAAELVFSAIWLFVRLIIWRKRGQISWKREAVLLLMYINIAVIIRFVFFPKAMVNGQVQPIVYDPETAFPFRINLVPFMHLFNYNSVGEIIWNVVGNMVLFIPCGIVLPIAYKRLDNFWKVVAAGALISLCIEIIQLPFASRASDIDDLIINTLGVAVGYGIYAAVKRLKR